MDWSSVDLNLLRWKKLTESKPQIEYFNTLMLELKLFKKVNFLIHVKNLIPGLKYFKNF